MAYGSNDSKITRAFDRLKASKDAVISSGLVRMMQYGLEALLEAHDLPIIGNNIYHHNELEKETLGWMVFHDGAEVASGTQDRGEISGNILLELESEGAKTTGWVGYIMSEMTYDWYRVDYEMDFLQYSAEEVKSSFNRFFKPVIR